MAPINESGRCSECGSSEITAAGCPQCGPSKARTWGGNHQRDTLLSRLKSLEARVDSLEKRVPPEFKMVRPDFAEKMANGDD